MVQEGHLLGLTGLDRTGPIETFVPPIAFAILFGLSMDYMVFLMSRIREEHVHGLDTRAAVEHGISAIGRVIVAAAIIMGTVFAAFILSADRIPKEFGLLLAVAILTDALIVRMTLVPSLLTLLGERSWYIPGWLDRLLPEHHDRAAARARRAGAAARDGAGRRGRGHGGARAGVSAASIRHSTTEVSDRVALRDSVVECRTSPTISCCAATSSPATAGATPRRRRPGSA